MSDYVRLAVVCREGGIYFDTDVEVITSIDELLQHEAFYAFENDSYVATGPVTEKNWVLSLTITRNTKSCMFIRIV